VQNLAPQLAALPGEGLPGARRRERSTRPGRADAGLAATHGPICRPGGDLTAAAVSMEAAQGTAMEAAMEMELETAQAATVVVSPVAVALAEQAPSAPGEVASRVLADSEARLAAAVLSLEAVVWPEPELAVRYSAVVAPAASRA
jgi:hypothetical protein